MEMLCSKGGPALWYLTLHTEREKVFLKSFHLLGVSLGNNSFSLSFLLLEPLQLLSCFPGLLSLPTTVYPNATYPSLRSFDASPKAPLEAWECADMRLGMRQILPPDSYCGGVFSL